MGLSGRVAVVTGGSQGIGQAICLRLAREGARIAVLDVNPTDETAAQLVAAGAECWSAECDIRDDHDVERSFAQLERDWCFPTVLVNAAGVFADQPFLETPVETWDRVMDINARGTFLCSQSAARRMRKHGGGRIVNILSTASAQGFALESAYCASKGAALLLTKVMAVELAPYGITVNGVGPGTVQTTMGSAYLGDGPIARHELERTPLGRHGRPEDVAEAVAFLAVQASWITGAALYVDGGFLAAGLPLLEGLGAVAAEA